MIGWSVVALTPVGQVLYFFQVGLFIVVYDQAHHSCVVSKLDDMVLELKGTTQLCVYWEYSRGPNIQPWGAPVLRIKGGRGASAHNHHLESACQKVKDQNA